MSGSIDSGTSDRRGNWRFIKSGYASALFGLLILGSASARADDSNLAAPTFHKDIAPILNANCVSCHRPGQIGPMSFTSFEETRPWAKSIRKVVASREMPPWDADPGFGPWSNERSLDEAEIAMLVRWSESGALMGDPADATPVPEFNDDGWILGEPDVVLAFPEVAVPGGGPDRFHDLKIQTDFGEDKWLKAIEVMPGNREVVHHVILWQNELGAGGGGQGWLGAWAAGARPLDFPEGTARLLKAGAPIIGDMHYHPTQDDATDITKIGLWFAEAEDIEKELINLWIINLEFNIPAGDPNYEAKSSSTFAQDSHLISLAPHMHYRGKDFSYVATYPDGTSEELLKVSDYDFNWQTSYLFEEPKAMPKGTRIDCVAHWDNSADNPSNPDPTKDISFGPESYDEMMIGFADYVVDEGMRPTVEVPDPIIAKIEELKTLYPGDIYALKIPGGPGGQWRDSAIYLPREGDGGWYISLGTFVGRAPIREIIWTGDSVVARALIPGQDVMIIKGKLDAANGTLGMVLGPEGGEGGFPAQAKRVD